jgi:GntR family transcriptional regulator
MAIQPDNLIGHRKEGMSLYTQVTSLIRNKILRGQLEPGERLPKEEDLAIQYGVSQITVRRALSCLAQERLICRHQGKGTFVADVVPLKRQFLLGGGLHEMVANAAKYPVMVLGIETHKVCETRIARDIKHFFSLNRDDPVGVLRRIRLLNETRIIYLENFISTEITKCITMKELSEKPLLKIFKDKLALTIGRGEMFLESVTADPDIAKFLGVQPLDPLIFVQSNYWNTAGDPLEVVIWYVRPDYFKYRVEIDAAGFDNI